MFKLNMILYFYIATTLVAGEWPTQDYGQSQLRYPSSPPLPPQVVISQNPIYSAVPGQTPSIPDAKPCRRRNFGEPAVVLTDSGWVPIATNQPSPPLGYQLPSNQQVQIPKPQSLTENHIPVVADNTQETGQTVRKSEYPDGIVEYVEKSTLPNQKSEKQSMDETESRRAPDEIFVQDAEQRAGKSQHSIHSTDSHEGSHECDQNGDPGQSLRYANSEVQDAGSRNAPEEVHEEAAKLLHKCAHDTRRTMQDVESDVRGFQPDSSSSEIDKIEADIPSKTKSIDNPRKNSKSARASSRNKVQPYLQNPAKNAGKWESDSHVSLLENGRVCYACSTLFDASCWTTNATTTIKYCNKENNACLNKMYRIDGKVILVRDCGHTCNEKDQYDIGQKMKSCSICHHDLCNGAAVHGLSGLLAALILSIIKFTSQ